MKRQDLNLSSNPFLRLLVSHISETVHSVLNLIENVPKCFIQHYNQHPRTF